MPWEQIQAQLGHKMPGETEKYACYAPGFQKEATAAIELFFERVLEAERLIKERSGSGQELASGSEGGGGEGEKEQSKSAEIGAPDRMKLRTLMSLKFRFDCIAFSAAWRP